MGIAREISGEISEGVFGGFRGEISERIRLKNPGAIPITALEKKSSELFLGESLKEYWMNSSQFLQEPVEIYFGETL